MCVSKLLCQRRMVRRQAKRKRRHVRSPRVLARRNQGDDLVTGNICSTLEQQHDRGIARFAPSSIQQFGGCLVNRFVGEVNCPDQRGVDLAPAQRVDGDLQRPQPRELLACHRIAGAAVVELRIDAVGRNVGHGAHDARRLEAWNQRATRCLEPLGRN